MNVTSAIRRVAGSAVAISFSLTLFACAGVPRYSAEPAAPANASAASTAELLGEEIVASSHDEMASPEMSSLAHTFDKEEISLDSATPDGFAAAPTLTGLSVEPMGEGRNMIVADLTSTPNYNMIKTSVSEYVLTIEGTQLDPDAGTTLLAPPNSGSIRSVRPVAEGNDLLLRIFSYPQADLVAETRAGKIIVRDIGAGFDSTQDMRAQPEPELMTAPPSELTADPTAAIGTGAAGAGQGATDFGRPVLTPASVPPLGSDEADLTALLDDKNKYIGRLISLDLQDTDIDNALRIIAEVSNLNIIASDDVQGKVTLRLIDVPWDQALDVILKTNGLDKVQEGNVIRIAPVEKLRQERESLKQARQAEEELEPLAVRYIRISYAKAADLKPLVDTVISERGTTAYDERTNQLIVKDIKKGIDNVTELVEKLDLRTPQVLLETQIVEANRNLLRDLGAQTGFSFVQSPATGNATGYNFPNSVIVGGAPGIGTLNDLPNISSFPAGVSTAAGTAFSFLFGSADGTKSLNALISALESEGRVRVISRPAVATTNNKQATIKSTEAIRVKTPQGGLSVATGQGAQASGNATSATEEIEVGIELTVTPQASPDYFILLDLQAKSSTFGTRVVDGIPSEVKREAQSTVLVSSGQTFAMGGIYKIQDRDSVQGMPFFKDIPFLGHLFRRTTVDNSDEELLFFITPRIVEGSFDDGAMRASS